MSPQRIELDDFVIEPTSQGGVLINAPWRFCHLPPGPEADEFWQSLAFMGSVDAALAFTQQGTQRGGR